MKKITLCALAAAFLASHASADTLTLNSGWNLAGTGNNVSNLNQFAGMSVFAYNAQTGNWKVYPSTSGLETLSGIKANEGFWIKSSAAKTLDMATVTTSSALTLNFTGIDYAKTDSEKRAALSSSKVSVNNKDYNISFNAMLKTGDQLPQIGSSSKTETFGLMKDQNGSAIKLTDGSNFICRTSSNGSGPDHTTLLPYGDKLFSITQFECSPGGMYITELNQDKTTGKLTPLAMKSIDQSADFGGFVHCAGIATPWGSHLGSEEYEANAKTLDANTGKVTPSTDYYNTTGLYFGGDQNKSNPYYYGWTPEVNITSTSGDTTYKKHYSMGRFAHELAYVMPDNKTVYLSDDGASVGLYMYIADKVSDLTAGTLYAAKWVQKSADNGGFADINWISLGSATDSEIRTIVATKPKFTDMFDEEAKSSDGKTGSTTGTCSSAYTSINTSWGHECLKLKTGMGKTASRLETRRYAAMLGATTEFNKEEGITFDSDRNRLYVAMSYVEKGMEDNKKVGKADTTYDKGSNNDIKLSYNSCGTVYAMDVTEGKKDSAGNAVNSSYVVGNMYGLISGAAKTYTDDVLSKNTCDIEKIANPDNITYLPKSNILIIGEDTDGHQNDAIWAYDLLNGKLTRIFSTPYGSETTSPFWYPNINGWGYMTGVIQHPFGESDTDKKQTDADLNSAVGYFGPFPSLSVK